jgi:hypothetical protein
MTSIAHIEQDQNFQGDSPSARDRIHAAEVDSQFQAFKQRFNDLLDATAVTIRDDNTLMDGIVRSRNLHSEVVALIASKAGWQPKADVITASTGSNITLSAPGATIGGKSMSSGNRFLAKDQTAAAENGIYTWNGASAAATRVTDADSADELGYAFVTVSVAGAATLAGTSWVCNQAADAITLGSTAITFGQAGGGAANVQNAQMADMAQATIKGRASGAGTGKPVDLTAAQSRVIVGISDAMLPVTSAATLAAGLAAFGSFDDAMVTPSGSTQASTLATIFGRYKTVKDFGAVGDGVEDDTASLMEYRDYIEANSIGVAIYPPGIYLVNTANTSGVGYSASTHKLAIFGYGAVIKKATTTAQHTMFYYRKDMAIYGLTLEGYATGSGYATANPPWSFGFRSAVGSDRVTFTDCVAHGLGYDGWYHDPGAAGGLVTLVNCSGYDCMRNDASIISGSVIEIGGKWGFDSSALTKVGAVDVEPDALTTVTSASFTGSKFGHKLNFIGQNGPVNVARVKDLIFDGSVYSATCGLDWQVLVDGIYGVDSCSYINGAALSRGGVKNNALGTGRFYTEKQTANKNLLANAYNSITGWTESSSGSVTTTPNVDIGDAKGIRIQCDAGEYLNYKQVITVEADTVYSFGAMISSTVSDSSTHGVYVYVDTSSYFLKPYTLGSGAQKVSGQFKVPAGITSVDFRFGSPGSACDMVFTDLYLIKGTVGELRGDRVTRAAAAPTTGTWAVGDVVWNATPSAAGAPGWVCVTAGTPGTWKAMANLAA